jgi:hypothetical protein
MTLTSPNVDESKKIKKAFGFFYNGKYYLNGKKDVKAIHQEF